MIRGIAAAALLGFFTLFLAVAGLLIVLPLLIARRWRRKMNATHG